MRNLKIGVFGTGRGAGLADNFKALGCEITAICDCHKERREAAAAHFGEGTAVYDNFDAFIEHGFDAVILANYFHEHAPYAIKCLERGIHVYSECMSSGTMAESVALIRAAEKSDAVYFLAENYPQMLFNREMKRIVDGGTLGKILFAEGEYNHPVSGWDVGFLKTYTYFPKHWRNYIPRTYYVTHSLGPLMHNTGATPTKVTAYAVFNPPMDDIPNASMCGDRSAVITTQNDDGSVFQVSACSAYGGHGNSYRICGTRGQMENLRVPGNRFVVHYNGWDVPEGKQEYNEYVPEWHDDDEDEIVKSGHGGADYITARMFLECIENHHQPELPFDVYSATTMASVSILAHRSVLAGGKTFDIPDFHTEEARKQYENDTLTPFYCYDGTVEPSLPCCSHPDYRPTDEQVRLYHEHVMQ